MSPKQESQTKRIHNATGIDPKTPGRGDKQARAKPAPDRAAPRGSPGEGRPEGAPQAQKARPKTRAPNPGENQGKHKNQQTLRTPIGVTGELKNEISILLRMGR